MDKDLGLPINISNEVWEVICNFVNRQLIIAGDRTDIYEFTKPQPSMPVEVEYETEKGDGGCAADK